MLEPRRIFYDTINPKEEAEPPCEPIRSISAHLVNKLDKYIKEMLAQGKIVDSKSPYEAPILFVPKLD